MIPKTGRIKSLSEFTEEQLKRYVLFVCKGTAIKTERLILFGFLMAPLIVLLSHLIFGMFFLIPQLDLPVLFIVLFWIILIILFPPGRLKKANRAALNRIIAYEKETGKKIIPEYLRARVEKEMKKWQGT
ncbi:MAG: hypothetical protein QMC80_09220 [Thermoplasmatales archaeon]|nr:hypothetical protein [Thermoplasmatales archaeon]